MTNDKDIIAFIREMQSWGENIQRMPQYSKVDVKQYLAAREGRKQRIADKFSDIAQALLTKDEQLKIAVEALEAIAPSVKNPCWKEEDEPYSGRTAHEALSRIRSL